MALGWGGEPLILAAALLADRLVGDPHGLWRRTGHPVVWAGRLVAALDAGLNDASASFARRRLSGIVAVLVIAAIAIAAGRAAGAILHGTAGAVAEAAIVAILLAQKSLLDHVRAVAAALRDGVPQARTALSMIVGRDVSDLDEAGIARGAVESLAENFSDGVVAPAFWYLVGGLPGLVLYKMVNTADSMIGHRSPRHEAFGWAAARLDDLLNLLPARLAALLVAAGAGFRGGDSRAALAAARRDASRHRSPNAGWPEAAMAGALGIALGGPRRYEGAEIDGAWLNAEGRRDASRADIEAALRIAGAAWGAGLALAVGLALLG